MMNQPQASPKMNLMETTAKYHELWIYWNYCFFLANSSERNSFWFRWTQLFVIGFSVVWSSMLGNLAARTTQGVDHSSESKKSRSLSKFDGREIVISFIHYLVEFYILLEFDGSNEWKWNQLLSWYSESVFRVVFVVKKVLNETIMNRYDACIIVPSNQTKLLNQ